jgi:long-chain acyl-CoA synthetase
LDDDRPRGGGEPRPTSVAQLVSRAAARFPDHPGVVDVALGRTATWGQLESAVAAEAARLRAAGVGSGARAVVRPQGGLAFCVAVLGALRAGAIAVPHGPVAVGRELELVLADCTPRVVVAPADDRAAAAAAGPALLPPPDVALGPGARPVADEPDVAPEAEDIALLVYTSSATGRLRGVRLSHRAVLANRAQTAGLHPAPVTPADRVLLALPLFHVLGLSAGLLQVCWSGATAVLTDRTEPRHLAEVVAAQRVSSVLALPSVYRALLDLPDGELRTAFAGVRLCACGGAPLPPRWLADFRAVTGLPVLESYGLSEAGPLVTMNGFGGLAKPGSVGRALPGVELRLVDAAGHPLDQEAADDEDGLSNGGEDTGLIAVRGPNLFSGYWPDGAGGPDADGWFRTPDVGFLDADGDLHLVDRSPDLVIVNGFNVYPHEVEQVLCELAGVVDAAVVGIPDDRTGEAVKAVVVTEPGAGLTEPDVRAHCAARLARFKVPAVIEFADALPRTPTGKVARRQLAGEAP